MTKEQFENAAKRFNEFTKNVLMAALIGFSQIAIDAIGKEKFLKKADKWAEQVEAWAEEHDIPPVNKPEKS